MDQVYKCKKGSSRNFFLMAFPIAMAVVKSLAVMPFVPEKIPAIERCATSTAAPTPSLPPCSLVSETE